MTLRQVTNGFWLIIFSILFKNCNNGQDGIKEFSDTAIIKAPVADTITSNNTPSKKDTLVDTPRKKLLIPPPRPSFNEGKGSGSAPGSGRPPQEPNPELRRYQKQKEDLNRKIAEEKKNETEGKETTDTKAVKLESNDNKNLEIKPK